MLQLCWKQHSQKMAEVDAHTNAGLVNSATGVAAALTGSNAQIAPAHMQTMISSTIKGSILAQNINGRTSPLSVSAASLSKNLPRRKDLQLDWNKVPTSMLTVHLAEKVANEAGQ
ncbi:uncharacterized protein BJ212DRAFT_1489454 [Suillus subaureus]|uniref:Uncharacterized protein n=1 Tax=Suillus subaureus TaxID=48587 RepID=A0A9P7AVT1_9AGAM|nr:uncharacterized protein BJ212DRAFT_1489454 [Suillus subaureus]KAG1796164.1 hypothetical protein BJ212DRAFT_1489454 [Suillus subaureus]